MDVWACRLVKLPSHLDVGQGRRIAEGVGLHAGVLVHLGHLAVLAKAVQGDHSHLLGGVDGGDQQTDENGANEESGGAHGHREADGDDDQRNADEKADQADAQARGDVFTPRFEEHRFA
jgi:hypothetical protein